MAKETNPKNTALEADVLKAAGAGEVDQQAVKDKAAEIVGKAPEGETIPGKVETMQGTPGSGVQMPGSDLPAANQAQAGIVPADYAEYLKWKASQEAGKPLAPVVDEYQEKERAAQDAARKAYNQVMDAPASTPHPNPDGEIKTLNETQLHQERLKMYGPGYVVAQRQGVMQVFTAQTWKLLGGRDNKDGYREVVAAPPEVQALNKNQ